MTDEDALVEKLARAICAASGDTWREGPLRGPGMGNRDSDSLNNHWRHKARTILPIVNARLDAITKERGELRIQGQREGFAAAVQWLRERSASKPRAPLWEEAHTLADQLEQSRIPFQTLGGNHEG